MNETDRQGYIDAIIKLLERADLRALRLIWIHAKGLVTENPGSKSREALTGFPLFFVAFQPSAPKASSPPAPVRPASQQTGV